MNRTSRGFNQIKTGSITGANLTGDIGVFDETRGYSIGESCWWNGGGWVANQAVSSLTVGDLSNSPTLSTKWDPATQEQNINFRIQTVAQTITTTASLLLFQSSIVDLGGFVTYNAGQFTFQRDGVFVVNVSVGFFDTANNRRDVTTKLQINNTDVNGFEIHTYNRGNAQSGGATASQQLAIQVVSGDILTVTSVVDGTDINTIPDSCTINIFVPGGERGQQGSVGPAGDFHWEGKWSTGSYNRYAVVEYNNSSFVSTIDGNTINPGTPDLPNAGWDLVARAASSSGGVQPYLEGALAKTFLTNQTGLTTDITGGNFDNNMDIDMGPEITVNSVTASSDKLATINFDTSITAQAPFNAVLSRGTETHFGGTFEVTTSSTLIGTGSAGVFTTNFDAGGTGQTAWGSDWLLEIFGTINSIDGFFATGTSTPSSNTGASTVSPQGGDFAFGETSNPNNGAGQYATMTTTNFREIERIQMDAYMYGADIGALVIETQNGDNSWTERYRQNGQIQTAQGQAWTAIDIDATTWSAKAVRITFEATSGYMGDICLDNIQITSV